MTQATKNKLEKTFGPVGSATGTFVFVAGLVATYYSVSGLILVVLGAFMGFTSTSTRIDFENKRVKLSNDFFGIIPFGKWVSIMPDMKLSIEKPREMWRAYSRSNRVLDISSSEYRLVLHEQDGTRIMPLFRTKSIDSAKTRAD